MIGNPYYSTEGALFFVVVEGVKRNSETIVR